MTVSSNRKPFSEDQLGRPRDALWAAATAAFMAEAQRCDPLNLVRDNPATQLILRAASNPATVGTASWAGNLAATAVADAFVAMAQYPAALGW